MSPRFSVRGGLVMTIVLVTTLIAVGGCRRRSSEATEFRDSHPLPAEPNVVKVKTPGRYGGRFVLGQTGNPKTFNAMMANESSSSDITNLTFSSLIDYNNETQEIEPALAKSWEVAPDGVTWTFHLRKGAAFSDGHPMTARGCTVQLPGGLDPTVHPSVQDLLKIGGKPYEVSAPDDHTFVVIKSRAKRHPSLYRRRRAHHAETRARGALQGRQFRGRL